MGVFHWLAQNGFTLLNAIGVVGGLLFTGLSFHSEARTRRIANLLTLTQNHRALWVEYFRNPTVARVLDPVVDVPREPVSRDEEIFVSLVIQHLSGVFHALKDELVIKPEGLRRDVWWFFSLPVPLTVWERAKLLQNDAFVAFVEKCRNWK